MSATKLRFGLTYPTGNRKIAGKTKGMAATSVTSRPSCPSTCSMYRTTQCYAENHWAAQQWNKVDQNGVSIKLFTKRLREIPPTVIWRHNVSGDLPHKGLAIDGNAVAEIVNAGRHLRGWTYTHHALSPHNMRIIQMANASGFTINASTESVEEADKVLDEHPTMPTVTICPTGTGKNTRTPQGRRVVTCPADYRDDWDCFRCGQNPKGLPLCAQADRDYVIGFLPKGASKKKVSARAATTTLGGTK